MSDLTLPTVAFLHEVADAADTQTMAFYRKALAVASKEKAGWTFDPVTEADRRAEIAMRSLIQTNFPAHRIIGEEFGTTGDGPVSWVLDPIDGTRPFLCGIPVWATIFGVTVGDAPRLGMLSQPFIGERFWGDGTGTYCRRAGQTTLLGVRNVDTLGEAILHSTAPEGFSESAREGFSRLSHAALMTRFGGECYAFAMLAAGNIAICVEPSMEIYDVVPLIPIVENAGGTITTIDGGRAEKGGYIVASSSARLHELALNLLNNH